MPLFLIIFTTYGQGLAISIELLNIFVESVTQFKHFVAILKKERNLYIFIHELYIIDQNLKKYFEKIIFNKRFNKLNSV